MASATRLDRLLNLLDTGSTTATRKAAAQQIGEVQKYHAHDLHYLLSRVHEYLRSKSWDTRVAAGHAIAAIASHVPLWSPTYREDAPKDDEDSGLLSFDALDLTRVLQHGAPLLASGGTEFDEPFDDQGDPKQRLAKQRKILEQRAGLADVGGFGDLVDEDDLVLHPTESEEQKRARLREEEEARSRALEVTASLANTKMSARERNRAKRKAKEAAKLAKQQDSTRRLSTSSNAIKPASNEASAASGRDSLRSSMKAVVTAQPQNQDKVVVEMVSDGASALMEADVWPFEGLCAVLCNELFDPCWEIRHGAAIGLREVLRKHANGAGKSASAMPDRQAEQNRRWLEDCTIRLLCVFALDRFGDYVGDQVVAPVRETCAQTLGTVLASMPTESVLRAFDVLLLLLQQQKWEIRHGGLLGLKYLIAVRKDLVQLLLPRALPSIIQGLKDSDDDVRAVASDTLLPIATEAASLVRDQMPEILSILWDILLELDQLTASTNSVMNLLAAFYAIPSIATVTLQVNSITPQASNVHPLASLVPRLWPFLRHTITSVREAALATLLCLLDVSHQQPHHSVSWVNLILVDSLRYIYQNIILESRQELVEQSHRVWNAILQQVSSTDIRAAALSNLDSWFQLLVSPADSSLLAPYPSQHRSTLPSNASASSSSPASVAIEAAPLLAADGIENGDGKSKGRKRGRSAKNGGPEHEQPNAKRARRSMSISSTASLTTSATRLGVAGAAGDTAETINVRIHGARALGALAAVWPLEHESEVHNLLWQQLNSNSAYARQAVALVLQEWAARLNSSSSSSSSSSLASSSSSSSSSSSMTADQVRVLSPKLEQHLLELLNVDTAAASYVEVDRLYQQLLSDYRIFLASMQSLAPSVSAEISDALTAMPPPNLAGVVVATPQFPLLPAAEFVTLANGFYDRWQSRVKSNKIKLEHEILAQLDARRTRLIVTAACAQTTHVALHTSVLASAAGALVAWAKLPSKLNPVIRALMDSIKREENEALQTRSAVAVARLTRQCLSRKASPTPKIISNLAAFVAVDRHAVPVAVVDESDEASITGVSENDEAGGNGNGGDGSDGGSTSTKSTTESTEAIQAAITRRGAEFCLCELARHYGERLFIELPRLWECMTSKILEYVQVYPSLVREIQCSVPSTPATATSSKGEQEHDQPLAQALVDSLHVFASILPHLARGLSPQVCELLLPVIALVRSSVSAVRRMAAQCLAAFCKAIPLASMHAIIKTLLPILGDTTHVRGRLGAALALHNIITGLGIAIVPYIPFFLVPILGRMSDQAHEVRRLVTNSFATLVRLMPLEAGTPNPEGLDPALVQQKERERRFLEQLLDGSKLDNYELPIPVNAELRKYQQEGVNWLAFLAKYKLHGILCDDMGLGKTLQTLCIIASDHYIRKLKYESSSSSSSEAEAESQPACSVSSPSSPSTTTTTSSPSTSVLASTSSGTIDNLPLPSFVVCPTTVVGHWFHECRKFFPNHLSPLMYSGSPHERERLRPTVRNHNLIVMSYDILRNDIDFLRTIPLNYCVLDEGHVIKNGKTKITKAVKSVQANHRLILSGTPIQNNVLELWSLFDFLMPGFLGTEAQFNHAYGKPILASKDPKCSPKDQEAGTLAMESLHRQVLPFLLRRVKEDVLHDLPPKIIQDYYCDLSPLQARLYEDFARSTINKDITTRLVVSGDEVAHDAIVADSAMQVAGAGSTKAASVKKGKNEGASHAFQALQYLRKLCNHPLLVLDKAHPQYNTVMQDLQRHGDSLHKLHHAPKLQALKQLLLDCGIGVVQSSSSSSAGDVRGSSSSSDSATTSESVISQHRVLIFAQLKSMLDIIENDLLKPIMPSVTYLRLDGSVSFNRRHELVTKFNEDPTIDLLLLTTHVGGLGLNLTGADTVIFVEHDWNPMKDLQAMDRAHRIGQKKVVNVYRLITRGTLEEKIMSLQKFKLNIAQTVVNQENSSLRTMDTDQLLDLFSYSAKPLSSGSESAAGAGTVDQLGHAHAHGGKKSGLRAILDDLEELWDEAQYEEEFNIHSFLDGLGPGSGASSQ